MFVGIARIVWTVCIVHMAWLCMLRMHACMICIYVSLGGACLSRYLPIFLSIEVCLPIYLSIHLSIYLRFASHVLFYQVLLLSYPSTLSHLSNLT